jgi:hypothetical protein
MVGCVRIIQITHGGIEVAELPGSFVQIRVATKILIIFFYPSIVRYSQAEENRQSEKLRSTLRGFEIGRPYPYGK